MAKMLEVCCFPFDLRGGPWGRDEKPLLLLGLRREAFACQPNPSPAAENQTLLALVGSEQPPPHRDASQKEELCRPEQEGQAKQTHHGRLGGRVLFQPRIHCPSLAKGLLSARHQGPWKGHVGVGAQGLGSPLALLWWSRSPLALL